MMGDKTMESSRKHKVRKAERDDLCINKMDIVKGKKRETVVGRSRKRNVKMSENESYSFYSSTDLCVSNENENVDDVENIKEMLKQDAPGISLQRFLCFQKEGEQTKDWREECFKPLTKEEKREVICAFQKSNTTKVLVNHEKSNSYITGEILQCLRPRGCLNDEVINLYLKLLKEREMRAPQKFLKCHFFDSFFYIRLFKGRGCYHFELVKKLTTQEKLGYNLLECDKIFMPIHQTNHWCLAVINKKEEKFQYLDSVERGDSQVQLTEDESQLLETLASYYVDEVKDKNGEDIDVSSWEREFVADIPHQENKFDCGMFMIKYVDFYSRHIELCFSQKDMPYFRKRTTMEILRLKAD